MENALDQVTGIMNALNAEMVLKANEIANRHTPGMHKSQMVWTSASEASANIRVVPGEVGSIKNTGRKTDVAIVGPHYFALNVDGATMASLSGSLRVNQSGRLVDSNAHQLITDRDYRLVNSDFVVEMGGQIRVGNTVVARIMAVAEDSVEWSEATNGVYFPVAESSIGFVNGSFIQGFINSARVDVNGNVADILRLKNAYKMNSETIQKLYSTDDMIIDGM